MDLSVLDNLRLELEVLRQKLQFITDACCRETGGGVNFEPGRGGPEGLGWCLNDVAHDFYDALQRMEREICRAEQQAAEVTEA